MSTDITAESFLNLKKALQTFSSVEVTFTKVNGEIRTMFCTLKKDRIPVDKRPKKIKKYVNPLVLAVYDIQEDAWRSFRIQSVIDWEISE